MIIKYREQSEPVEIHSHDHGVCTHRDELDDGWYCSCTDCRCETVIKVTAGYAYTKEGDHRVMIEMNPGDYRNATGTLSPDMARALAAALCFAANDADTLNKEFPND